VRPRGGALTPLVLIVTALSCAASGCSLSAASSGPAHGTPATRQTISTWQAKESPTMSAGRAITSWLYQLQNYPDGRLDALARAPQPLAVIDLARDAGSSYFRRDEIEALRRSGKTVLAYFEIGSIENFRPEYEPLLRHARDLVLNRWDEWPGEFFVRYWDERWWTDVVRPRVDQALRAGFDGVYLDTPLAYEELDLSMVRGWTRDKLARAMVHLIVRISRYAKARRPGFWIFPQNSPELRVYPGYVSGIDGIGMEELFFQATDHPCVEDWCAENLAHTRVLRDAGKLVLAVDYASRPRNIEIACRRYAQEHFAGNVTVVDLDKIRPPCPSARNH
jgi:cysteinyl-tRNA synthetase